MIQTIIRRACFTVLSLFAVLALGAWAVKAFFLPDLSVLQPRIEATLSAALQQPVQVQGLRASLGAFHIEIHLDQLRVGDANKPTLELTALDASIATLPLITQSIELTQASAQRVSVQVQHGAQGAIWRVAGVVLGGEKSPHSAAILRTVLGAGKVQIDALELLLEDPSKRYLASGHSAMLFNQTQLSRDGFSHALSVQSSAGLPDIGSGSFALTGRFKHGFMNDVADARTWRDGRLDLVLSNAQPAALERWAAYALPFKNSTPQAAKLLGEQFTLALGVEFNVGELGLKTTATLPLQAALTSQVGAVSELMPARISLSWPRLNTPKSELVLAVDRLNLGALKTVRWPAPYAQAADMAQYLQALNLRGQLSQTVVSARLLQTEVLHWQLEEAKLTAQLNGVYADAARIQLSETPALGNVSASIAAHYTPKQAQQMTASAQFASQSAWITLPEYRDAPVLADSLTGEVGAVLSKTGGIKLNFKKINLRNDDMSVQLDGSFAQESQKNLIDLRLAIPTLELAKIASYLPKTASAATSEWFGRAMQAGRLKSGALRVVGDLARFPFTKTVDGAGEGERLEFEGQIDNATLVPAKGVPALTQLQGFLQFKGGSVLLENATAYAHGLNLTVPSLRMADVQKPVLDIQANAAGPAQSFIGFLQQTAVGENWAEQGNVPVLDGFARLEGRWQLPLEHMETIQFSSRLSLNAAKIQIAPWLPAMSDVALMADVNERGFKIHTAKAKWLGGAMQADGAALFPHAAAAVPVPRASAIKTMVNAKDLGQVKLVGTVSVSQLSELAAAGGVGASVTLTPAQTKWVAALGRLAIGELSYQAVLSSTALGWGLSAESDMLNVALNFPKLYFKNAQTPLPITVRVQQDDTAQGAIRSTVRAGEQFKMDIEHSLDPKTQALRLERGAAALGFDSVLSLPDEGLNAHIVLPQFDADALGDLFASLPWDASLSSGTKVVARPKEPPANSNTFAAPIGLALQVGELTAAKRVFKNIVAGVGRTALLADKASWQANIYADGVNGYLTWSEAGLGAAASRVGTLKVRLASLLIPDSEVQSASTLLDIAPNQVPNVDADIDELIVSGKPLGALKLRARNLGVVNLDAANKPATASSGWAIDQLQLKSNDSEINATGLWRRLGAQAQVDLKVAMNSQDLGVTLARLGQNNVVRGAAGSASGNISWHGTPFGVDLPSLSGELTTQLGQGQFLKVDPGAGRMLAVFSLQSIPRRLTLDFRDMFSDGFAFDSLTASARLEQGVLSTTDFFMQSAAAEVKGAGQVNLVKETQALSFTVRPDFNAGGVSLAYMLINPPLGLGTLLVQWLLREPLSTQLTVAFDVTGPWAKPLVKQRERNVQLKPDVVQK